MIFIVEAILSKIYCIYICDIFNFLSLTLVRQTIILQKAFSSYNLI